MNICAYFYYQNDLSKFCEYQWQSSKECLIHMRKKESTYVSTYRDLLSFHFMNISSIVILKSFNIVPYLSFFTRITERLNLLMLGIIIMSRASVLFVWFVISSIIYMIDFNQT